MSERCIWSGLFIVVFSVLPVLAQTQAGISGVICTDDIHRGSECPRVMYRIIEFG